MKLPHLVLSLVFILSARSFANSIVTEWNDLYLQAVRDVKFVPPQLARAGAIIHTCIYDAWACFSDKANGTIYDGFFRRPEAERTDANKIKAISYAAYRALVDRFPTRKADFDAKMASLTFDPADNSTDLTTPAGIRNVVSNAVITQRHSDRSNHLGDLHPGAYIEQAQMIIRLSAALNDKRKASIRYWPDGRRRNRHLDIGTYCRISSRIATSSP